MGYIGLSYLGGCHNATKADYEVAQGERVMVSPDNDLEGEIAAYEAALKCLDAGATGVLIMEKVGAFRGSDLADLELQERQAVIQQAAVSGFITTPAEAMDKLEWPLALLKCRREQNRANWYRCTIDGRRLRRAVVMSSNSEDQAEIITQVEAGLKSLNAAGRDPLVYRRLDRTAILAERDDSQGSLGIREASAEILGPITADAVQWSRGWSKPTLVCLGSEPAAEGFEKLRSLELKENGYLKLGTWEKKGEEAEPAWLYIYPLPHYPNLSTVRKVASNPSTGIPPLTGIVPCPFLFQDEIVTQQGYHSESGLYLDLSGEEITEMSAGQGLTDWQDLLDDFPFQSKSDFVSVLAHALTPMVHFSTGTAPIAFYSKPAPRTGATLIAFLVIQIVSGQPAYPTTYKTDEEEMSKVVVSILRGGRDMVLLDNVRGVVNSDSLKAVLTSPSFSGRILGKSDTVDLDTRNTSWAMTGNNLEVGKEIIDRGFLIQLDAQHPDPGQRSGPSVGARKGSHWRYPDIVNHGKDNRGKYLSGLVAILREWLKRGTPGYTGQLRLGMFEKWLNAVGGALDCVGATGLLDNKPKFAERSDTRGHQNQDFVEIWLETYGESIVTSKELFTLAGLDDGDSANATEPLLTLRPPPKGGRLNTTSSQSNLFLMVV